MASAGHTGGALSGVEPEGLTDTATVDVTVYPRTQRETGISINDGAAFTQTRDVRLTLGWPARAQQVRISNDGGFAGAATYDLQDTIDWVLDDSVNVVATQVVYVRFIGPGVDPTRTFSDNIIFDNTPPDLLRATAVIPVSKTQVIGTSSTARSTRTWPIKVRARDDRSGLATMQISIKRSGKPLVVRAYRSRTNVKPPAKTKRLYLRVSDQAGNWTHWRAVRVEGLADQTRPRREFERMSGKLRGRLHSSR